MTLAAPAAHFPIEPPPFRLSMGLAAVPFDALAEIDTRYPGQIVERARLLGTARLDCLAWKPDTEAARQAVLDRVTAALTRTHPALFALEGAVFVNRITGERFAPGQADPLEIAGRNMVEDVCVLRPGRDGPVLIAACVCFPARWRLADKIGRPLVAIHAPVPAYAERMRAPVDRLFTTLAPGKMVARRNWSVVVNPALHQPGDGPAPDGHPVTAAAAGALCLRVERQTLSRLHGDMLFTIGTHVRTLAEVCATAGNATALMHAIEALPAPMLSYKGIAPFKDAVCAWLALRAGVSAE